MPDDTAAATRIASDRGRDASREAVRRLRARGLVERHRGRASFLNEERLTQPVGSLYSLFQVVEERRLEPVLPDAEAIELLYLEPGEALLRVRRLGRSDDRPVEFRPPP